MAGQLSMANAVAPRLYAAADGAGPIPSLSNSVISGKPKANSPARITSPATNPINSQRPTANRCPSSRRPATESRNRPAAKSKGARRCVKAGSIVEQGTHQDLLAANGFYHELYASQFEEALDPVA